VGKGLVEHLTQEIKMLLMELLVHCSAFPHAINNSSCFQTKLQSHAVIVSFVVGCGKAVVNYASAEKQRLLKEKYAWWPTSASRQLMFGHQHFKLLCILCPYSIP